MKLWRIEVVNPGGEYTGNFHVDNEEAAEAMVVALRRHGYAGLVQEVDWDDGNEKNPDNCLTCGHTHKNEYGDDCWSVCQTCQDAQNVVATRSGHLEACGYTMKATGEEINDHLTKLVSPSTLIRKNERDKCGSGYWAPEGVNIAIGFGQPVAAIFQVREGRPVLIRIDVDGVADLKRRDLEASAMNIEVGKYWEDYAIDVLLESDLQSVPWWVVHPQPKGPMPMEKHEEAARVVVLG